MWKNLKKENDIELLRNEDIKKILWRCKRNGYGTRKTKNEILKEEKELQEIKNSKDVKEIYIDILWKKSYMWGMNPHAIATVIYKDGSISRQENFTCSGCGYDKESTIIAQIFNTNLRYKL